MSGFAVSGLAAALALATVGLSAVSYFFVPKEAKTVSVYAAYFTLVATVGVLLHQTGGVNSPFIALWMFTLVFAGIFGTGTLVILVLIVNAYLVNLFLGGVLTKEAILGLIMGGELPILISYILWHSKSGNEKSKDRAYYDLANELNQVSNKSDVVISAIGDGVIAIDNQGVIELINPAAQRIIGWGRQDAIGLDYKSVLQLQDAQGHDLTHANDPVFEVLTTNQQKHTNTLSLQTNSGKKINVSVVASPIGHLGSGAIIVFRDITKEQEEEHAQAEFISTASHEMRTPVASIEGYLGLALNPATATIDDKARDFITKAHESAQHLGHLFQDLLDVSKADDGRLSNNPKVIDMGVFVQDIIEGLTPKAEAKGLRVFFKPDTVDRRDGSATRNMAPVFYANLDADHLREVFSNLIENAIKYTPKGDVMVDVTGDNEHIVVSIQDSGIGIPTEDIPHLFQKFYRVDNSATREIGGTGLGLYLCRRLIESMDGRIWVESEYKKGSTFSVELPRISNIEANRLIELSTSEESEVTETRIMNEDALSSTPTEREAALNTPIVIREKPISTAADTSLAPRQEQAPAADILTPAAAAPVAQPAPVAATPAVVAPQPATPAPAPTPTAPVAPPQTPVAPAAAPQTVATAPTMPAPAPQQPQLQAQPQTKQYVGPIIPQGQTLANIERSINVPDRNY